MALRQNSRLSISDAVGALYNGHAVIMKDKYVPHLKAYIKEWYPTWKVIYEPNTPETDEQIIRKA